MKILFQGSLGAYSHLAALEIYPDIEPIIIEKLYNWLSLWAIQFEHTNSPVDLSIPPFIILLLHLLQFDKFGINPNLNERWYKKNANIPQ